VPPELENLTEALQRHLGVQQAQTFEPENITADAIARLAEKRGDSERLEQLWRSPDEAAQDLVEGDPTSAREPLLALRKVLDSSLVVNRYASGVPKSFLPFTPLFVRSRYAGSVYRDLGRSVVEALWDRPGLATTREQIRDQVAGWGVQHPLALLLAPLCRERATEKVRDKALLAAALDADADLRAWADQVVVEDWKAWVQAGPRLSVDEQVETMTGLIGLHLHVALLWRLGDTIPLGSKLVRDRRYPPLFFLMVEGQESDAALAGASSHACLRAACNFLGFWRGRAYDALELVAGQAVEQAATEDETLRNALAPMDWTAPRVWLTLRIRGKRTERAQREFASVLETKLQDQASLHREPDRETVTRLVVEALARPFSGVSLDKFKDFLRGTGRAAGIVGPNQPRSRRRYLLDERGLSLLARLHACRAAEDVRSDEEDRASVEAFLDDIFDRYGMIITTERSRVRERLARGGPLRQLEALFPSEEAVRRNRTVLDRRLDALRLVRRYSDASAVIRLP
jgi:hypothetical protein